MTNQQDTKTAAAKQTRNLSTVSSCGKWKTFHGFAGLMQYIPSGQYYARAKVDGTVKRASLETDVWTTAKDRLADKITELRGPKIEVGTIATGRAAFEHETATQHDLAELSRTYRLRCLDRLLRSWPGLCDLKADSITKAQMDVWAKKYAEQYAAQFFNNSLNVFRRILELSGLSREANPAYQIKRLGIPAKQLKLPTAEQFATVLHEVENSGAGQSKDCANFVRFLAFSGARVSEAIEAKWSDVDWKNNEITLRCAKRRAASTEMRERIIPLVPAMSQFLKAAQAKLKPGNEDKICRVHECQKSLTRACKIAKCPRLTHHSLRHLFATFCIEAGIDIPSVSRWLGHSDGGALAMRVYGHLRREHSQLMAQRVTFGATLPEPVPTLQLPEPKTINA